MHCINVLLHFCMLVAEQCVSILQFLLLLIRVNKKPHVSTSSTPVFQSVKSSRANIKISLTSIDRLGHIAPKPHRPFSWVLLTKAVGFNFTRRKARWASEPKTSQQCSPALHCSISPLHETQKVLMVSLHWMCSHPSGRVNFVDPHPPHR